MQVTLTPDQLKALRQLLRMHMLGVSLKSARAWLDNWDTSPDATVLGLVSRLIVIHDDIDTIDLPLQVFEMRKDPMYTLEVKDSLLKLFREILDEDFSAFQTPSSSPMNTPPTITSVNGSS